MEQCDAEPFSLMAYDVSSAGSGLFPAWALVAMPSPDGSVDRVSGYRYNFRKKLTKRLPSVARGASRFSMVNKVCHA